MESSGSSHTGFKGVGPQYYVRRLKIPPQPDGIDRFRIEVQGQNTDYLRANDNSDHLQSLGAIEFSVNESAVVGEPNSRKYCSIVEILAYNEDELIQMSVFSVLLQRVKRYCFANTISHLGLPLPPKPYWFTNLLPSAGFQLCRCWLPYQMKKDVQLCVDLTNHQGKGGMEVDPESQTVAISPSITVTHDLPRAGFGTPVSQSIQTTGTSTAGLSGPAKKQYCTFWLSRGECFYKQQGCRYSHDIPQDRETWQRLGFRQIPEWLREEGFNQLTSQRPTPPAPSKPSRQEFGSVNQIQSQLDAAQRPTPRDFGGGVTPNYPSGHRSFRPQTSNFGAHAPPTSSTPAGYDVASEFLDRNFPEAGFEKRRRHA